MVDRRMSTNSSAIGQLYSGQRNQTGFQSSYSSNNNMYCGNMNSNGNNGYSGRPPKSPEYNQSYGRQNGYNSGYTSNSGGSVSRLYREGETMSAGSGSVNERRRRYGLAQVNEGVITDNRGDEDRESPQRSERKFSTGVETGYRGGSQNDRSSVKSREISVRRGSVTSQKQSGPHVGNTFSRVPDPEGESSPTFSGDETDKEFHFVGRGSDNKTLKYDSKNFSFRLKNRDSVVVEQSEGRCSWRQAFCNSLYLGLAAITLVFIVMLLSTSPQNYRCCKLC